MLYQLIDFVLQIVVGLVAGTCLLRALFHVQGVSLSPSSGNTLGPFIFAVTNWAVLPLRRVLPSFGRVDTASLASAYLIILAKSTLLWLIASGSQSFEQIPIYCVFECVKMGLSCLNGLVLLYAVMTWISSNTQVIETFARLVNPMLIPIRRVVPLVGGIDLSPLVLLALIQIGQMLVESLYMSTV